MRLPALSADDHRIAPELPHGRRGLLRTLIVDVDEADVRAIAGEAHRYADPTTSELGYWIPEDAIPISLENVQTDYKESPTSIAFRLSNGNHLVLRFLDHRSCVLLPQTQGRRMRDVASFIRQFPVAITAVPVLGPVEHDEFVLEERTVRRGLSTHRASRHFRNYWRSYPERFDEFASQVRANKGVRQEIIDAEVGASTQAALDDALALCRAWGTAAPRPRENQAVVSGIPALVLDGQFDPITPPTYGQLAAEKLSRSYVFEFRGSGHGVTYQQYDCATGMINQFLARPTSRPDSGCLASISPLDFVIGDAPKPATELPVTPPVRSPSGISAPDTGTGNAGASRKLDARWAVGLIVAGALLVVFGAANVVRWATAGRQNRAGNDAGGRQRQT